MEIYEPKHGKTLGTRSTKFGVSIAVFNAELAFDCLVKISISIDGTVGALYGIIFFTALIFVNTSFRALRKHAFRAYFMLKFEIKTCLDAENAAERCIVAKSES